MNMGDYLALRARLAATLARDEHVDANGEYHIRSLYFDDYRDRALYQKLDGVNEREKFRLRCYNGDTSLIFLEKKLKRNCLCAKLQTCLSTAQARALLAGDTKSLLFAGDALLSEFCVKSATHMLRPKTIVEYAREPFVFAGGNVRVTLDRDVRTGITGADFFSAALPTVAVPGPSVLLEVKYDEFLPDFITELVQIGDRPACAFSKYAACRIYG